MLVLCLRSREQTQTFGQCRTFLFPFVFDFLQMALFFFYLLLVYPYKVFPCLEQNKHVAAVNAKCTSSCATVSGNVTLRDLNKVVTACNVD